MARSLGNIIADSLQRGITEGEKLLRGITAEHFARFARPGGEVVTSNHPAFIYGHLAMYGPRIVSQLGGEAASPAGFEEVFSMQATCTDDPDGTIYPPMDDITTAFFTGYEAALQSLRSADDSTLQQPNPTGGRMTELFPTLGSMHNFYAGGHLMVHMGQLSAWRRMMGMPPA